MWGVVLNFGCTLEPPGSLQTPNVLEIPQTNYIRILWGGVAVRCVWRPHASVCLNVSNRHILNLNLKRYFSKDCVIYIP